MLIKPHATKNEYIRAGEIWVRNFTKPHVQPLALDHLFQKEDQALVADNESQNIKYARISDEKITLENIVIVSDGYSFASRVKLISKFQNIAILAVNKTLRKWTLNAPTLLPEERRSINAYVVNNPYHECISSLPLETKYYPVCIASTRTNANFLSKYSGNVYVYEPTPEQHFGGNRKAAYHIDDYRNPICAAIGIAYRFGVKKLLLLCCDDSFAAHKDYAVQLKNGLWTYPQHIRSQEIIDANLYWLGRAEREISIADYSDGIECANAQYIKSDDEAIRFFTEEGQP